ncbi:hypothetical protein HCUR_00196 [Holospora curviuscula]|uniref:Uncharacterized protein n=1 Tax=Holospora curviuscula TaxID=1082868 RepID=A0A2S5RE15_9PROT|nr:hypothetical protein HCUR_00196 [Holospora curviuscula]
MVNLGELGARQDFQADRALTRLRNDFQVRRIHRQMTLNRTVQVVHPLALVSLGFLENARVLNHLHLFKTVLPYRGG